MNFLKPTYSSDEREIIDNILQGGAGRKRGEERLFNRYAYFIQDAVYKYSLSQEEAFDVYSDTVISAIDNIAGGSFHEQSSLKTWMYRIFKNKYVDLIRKKTTNKMSIHQTSSISETLFELSDHSKTIIQKLVEKSDWSVLKQRLSQVGETCRKMLMLWAEGYSDKEVAGMLDYKTADVVKTTRMRCLEKLKQLYRST